MKLVSARKITNGIREGNLISLVMGDSIVIAQRREIVGSTDHYDGLHEFITIKKKNEEEYELTTYVATEQMLEKNVLYDTQRSQNPNRLQIELFNKPVMEVAA